jgi:iron complex transport system ATP-binding protein
MFEVCILAGGKSSRMGRAKGELLLEGMRLVDWAKTIARGAGLPYRVIDADLEPSRGPLSGVRTAQKTSKARYIIFLSCDMPFVRSGTLRQLMEAMRGETNAIFAVNEGRTGFPFAIAKNASTKSESLQELARTLRAQAFPISDEEAFNINTPKDFSAAERLLKARNREVILDVDAMAIRRGSVEILRNVSWQVRRGEHWAILGANGSGKTSLLSVLTGYMSATAGRVRVLGREFGRSDWRELRKHVGLVSSALRHLMAEDETALETVASGKEGKLDLREEVRGSDRRRAKKILEEVGCSDLEKRVWAVLSQGERQRVLIARALMGQPQLLILDEPCAGLDPAAREHFLEFVQSLTQKRNAPAIILVTHHVEEIVPGISHVLALEAGRVAAAGPKEGTLTSRLLSLVFHCEARLRREKGRYQLQVRSRGAKVM